MSSPSLLKEVIESRRNLTAKTLEGFLRALELDGEAAAFFTALVELDQAPTDEEKTAAWDHVASYRRFRTARPIDGAKIQKNHPTMITTAMHPAAKGYCLVDVGFIQMATIMAAHNVNTYY